MAEKLSTILKIEICGKPDNYDWIISFNWSILQEFVKTKEEKKKILRFLGGCSSRIKKLPIKKQ